MNDKLHKSYLLTLRALYAKISRTVIDHRPANGECGILWRIDNAHLSGVTGHRNVADRAIGHGTDVGPVWVCDGAPDRVISKRSATMATSVTRLARRKLRYRKAALRRSGSRRGHQRGPRSAGRRAGDQCGLCSALRPPRAGRFRQPRRVAPDRGASPPVSGGYGRRRRGYARRTTQRRSDPPCPHLRPGEGSTPLDMRHDDRPMRDVGGDIMGLWKLTELATGGHDPFEQSREQWNDGSNVLALPPRGRNGRCRQA